MQFDQSKRRAFIALLGSLEAQKLLRATGFEPPAGQGIE